MCYTIRPAADTSGVLLVCTLTADGKQKSFSLVPRDGAEEIVLWVSRTHSDEAQFIEVAQRHFTEIERDAQRWLPTKELRLFLD